METNLDNQPNNTVPMPPTASFEQKLYRTLRSIDSEMLTEYMESFGLEADRTHIGAEFKNFADRMSEDEFCMAMKNGTLPVAQLSAVEIEVLHRSQGGGLDPECGSSAAPA